MRRFLSAFSFLLLLGTATSCSAAPAGGTLRPTDLITSPETYLGKSVDLLIVEPLYGAASEAALKSVEYGQMEVMIPDAVGANLNLVPAAFKPEDPNRFHNKFDRVLQSPVRVKGDFLKDAEMTESMHRPYYVIRVTSWEPAALEAPMVVKSLAEIKSDPSKWDRKRIVYEGIYENRFEVSAIDKEIWLDFQANTKIVGPQPQPGSGQTSRVRVTGFLFAKPDARYGHLGGYKFEILASKLEFLQ